MFLSDTIDSLLKVIYPEACAICGARCHSLGRYVCWECLRKVEYHRVDSFCERCGLSFEPPIPMPATCHVCKETPPAFDKARSAVHFRGVVKELIVEFKYHSAMWLTQDLTNLLEANVRHHYDHGEAFDAVCPVPLHPTKQRARGYNQAELLAGELARRLGLESFPNILKRTRNTETQTHKTAVERRANIHGIFEVNPQWMPWLRDRRILMVDDVMTTGSTLNEAAKTLKAAGVSTVLCATVARG